VAGAIRLNTYRKGTGAGAVPGGKKGERASSVCGIYAEKKRKKKGWGTGSLRMDGEAVHPGNGGALGGIRGAERDGVMMLRKEARDVDGKNAGGREKRRFSLKRRDCCAERIRTRA